jgi:hypothetical protein
MGIEIEIGGMTPKEYADNLSEIEERDPTGMIGIELANAVDSMGSASGFLGEIGGDGDDRAYWDKIARIALRRFPELQQGERVGVGEVKRRLGELRGAGYAVGAYSRMGGRQLWGYFMGLRRNVRKELRDRGYVDLIEYIDRENAEQRRAARDELR